MRLGGPLFGNLGDPDAWVEAARRSGYRAVVLPDHVDLASAPSYAAAAQGAGLVISEVGAWSNPLSPDEGERRAALARCRERLALADEVGARCCVNISGSRGARWDGPHPANLTPDTFDLIVETVQGILDDVRPTRAFYALETMPWMYPDSPDSYLDLLRAIDRPQFAVHLDPVNLIASPRAYHGNADLIRECFAKLGSYIKSCHAKDILLGETLTLHLDEVRPGLGALDYRVFLRELGRLDPDTPLVLEHLSGEDEYAEAAAHIRSVAREVGVTL